MKHSVVQEEDENEALKKWNKHYIRFINEIPKGSNNNINELLHTTRTLPGSNKFFREDSMGTYTRILYQIVFQTKHWEETLTKQNRERLFTFISGILIKKECFVYQVGGVENHIHIITHVHPNIAVSQLVKDIKLASTTLIRSERLFSHFKGWNEGFGAFTYTPEMIDNLIKYVLNQEAHHKKETPQEEYLRLLREFEIEFEEKYIK